MLKVQSKCGNKRVFGTASALGKEGGRKPMLPQIVLCKLKVMLLLKFKLS